MVLNGGRDEEDLSSLGQEKSDGILEIRLLTEKVWFYSYKVVHSSPCLFKFATSNSNFFFIEEFQ